MKAGKIIIKITSTLEAFVIAASVADFISKSIMGRMTISPTYFYMAFFPMLTLIWMKYSDLKRRVIKVVIAVALCIVASLATPVLVGLFAQYDIRLAAMIGGFLPVGVVFVAYAWLWGSLRMMSSRDRVIESSVGS